MMETKTSGESIASQVEQEHRKQQRFAMPIPIQVAGQDCHGRFFCEATQTEDESEAGCRFALRNAELAPGAVVAIQVISRKPGIVPPKRPAFFEVQWCEHEPDGRWDIGALKVRREGIWDLVFAESVMESDPAT